MTDGPAQPEIRARKPRRRSSGIVVPQQVTARGRYAAALISLLVRAIDATLRYRLHDPSDALVRLADGPVIFAIWHNRLALSLMLYRRFVLKRQPERKLAGLVSASRDGGMLAQVLRNFDVQPVRGSSSRRGPQALLELTSWSARGYDLAITPDGPRGPRYVVQEGVIAIAQLTGMPILPVSFHVPWRKEVPSWDRFQIPLPFSRCDVFLGEPLQIPRQPDDKERRQWCQSLEQVLSALNHD